MPTENELAAQLKRLGDELDRRIPTIRRLDNYYDGNYPLPPLVQDTDATRAYRMLMDLTAENWPKLIVDSVEERLEVQGIRFGDKRADEEAWRIWQDNGLDAEAPLLHQSTLTDGRAYAIVWGDGSLEPEPVITFEHASLCAVEYEPGNRRKRKAALRRWYDGSRWYANYYTPDAIYKFRAERAEEELPMEATSWKRHEVKDEAWPLPNPLQDVPVVEFAVNRSLRPAPFGTGAGEYEPNLRHIDRIHYKIFSGLVALTWSGFPLRYIIGDPIVYEKDEDGNDDESRPKKKIDALASSLAAFEDPNVKLGQLPEANIDNYSPEMDIKHLAAVTKTPASYLLPGMINLSDDAIRGMERALVAKAKRHQRPLGESHEDVIRLAFKVRNPDDPRGSNQQAQVDWKEPETRSLAEVWDAATKAASINTPMSVILSKIVGMTPQEVAQAKTEGADDIFAELMRRNGTENEPVVTPNGASADGSES